MKVKEKDLVVGDQYWFDTAKEDKGFFVGTFKRSVVFFPIGETGYVQRSDGTVGFPIEGYQYEEVE